MPPAGDLTGQVAIVTGSSRGIGRACAEALARAGAAVVVNGRSHGTGPNSAESVAAAVRESGGAAIAVAADVREDGAAELLCDVASAEFGRINVLINNAAVFGPYVPTWRLTAERLDETLATNLRGVFLLTQRVIPHLTASGGSIVNLTSLTADPHGPVGTDVAYAISKAAINRLTFFLSDELSRCNIAVNGLNPQSLLTEGAVAALGAEFDFSEFAPAESIADAVVFLARCRAEFTGHLVCRDEIVDGQYHPRPDRNMAGRAPGAVEALRRRFG